MSSTSNRKPNWVSAIFLSVTPVLALITTIWFFRTHEFEWWMLGLFLFFYFATTMSITAGYHRYWAHRTYNASTPVRWLLMLFGAAAFQSSILTWATDHRLHHRFVDQDEDPYCIHKGFWYAHFFWMFTVPPAHPMQAAFQRDLLKDQLVVWQDRYYVWVATFMCFVLPMLIGWAFGSALGGLLIGGLLRVVAGHHVTFAINSVAHYWGGKQFTDDNSARDNWVLAVLTSGEGYHNYHHLFANDYRNGIRWYHWDPTKWLIGGLAAVGLVTDLKRTDEKQILAAMMAMTEKQLPAQNHLGAEFWSESIARFRNRLQAAHARFLERKSEYTQYRDLKQSECRAKIEQLRVEMKEAKYEMRRSMALWRASIRRARRYQTT